MVTDNLSSHTSVATREWLAEHPRIRQVFIPKGACWLNLQEGWWRLFRRQALAGQCFADTGEIAATPGVRADWALLTLLPGALCAATVTGLRLTEGRPRLAVAVVGVFGELRLTIA